MKRRACGLQSYSEADWNFFRLRPCHFLSSLRSKLFCGEISLLHRVAMSSLHPARARNRNKHNCISLGYEQSTIEGRADDTNDDLTAESEKHCERCFGRGLLNTTAVGDRRTDGERCSTYCSSTRSRYDSTVYFSNFFLIIPDLASENLHHPVDKTDIVFFSERKCVFTIHRNVNCVLSFF